MVDRRACDTANGNANGNARQCSEDAHIAGKIAFQPAMLQREPAIRHYLQYWPKPANALGDRQCPYLVLEMASKHEFLYYEFLYPKICIGAPIPTLGS